MPKEPTPEEIAKGALPFLIPLPRWEVTQPGEYFRAFERGGIETGNTPPEPGNPNVSFFFGLPQSRRSIERFMRRYFLIAKDVGALTRVFAAKLEADQVKLAPRCSETPKYRPYFLAAFCQSPTDFASLSSFLSCFKSSS